MYKLYISVGLICFLWILEILILKFICSYIVNLNKSKSLLKDLENLKLEKKISDKDYNEKRADILGNLESKKLLVLAVILFFVYLIPLCLASYLLFNSF